MTKQTIHVALLGMGTVGSGVYEILMKRQAEHFQDKIGSQLTIKTIMVLINTVIKLMKKSI